MFCISFQWRWWLKRAIIDYSSSLCLSTTTILSFQIQPEVLGKLPFLDACYLLVPLRPCRLGGILSFVGFSFISCCITIDPVLEVTFFLASWAMVLKFSNFPISFCMSSIKFFRYSIIYKKLNSTFHFKSLLKLKIFQSCMIFLNNSTYKNKWG